MFYICDKCKRRWQYPLGDCPHCLAPLKEMESRGARVKSVVKVSIPTLLHPDVPYYILLLEDAAGNIWGHKSEKEYKIGDEFETTPSTDPAAVAVWRVKYDIGESVQKILELIGGISVNPDSKIIVLPTLAKPSHYYFRDNTSPEFLAAVLQVLLDSGAQSQNITVAGQNFDDIPVAAMAQKSGLIAAGAKFNVNALDLAESEFIRVGDFDISQKVASADLIVNLAMEKMGQAVAAANMFKVLKKESYLGQKYLSSDLQIASRLEPLLAKMVVIGEAEFVQRSNKLTAFMGLVFAGRSPRNIDRVFNEIARSFKLPEIIKDIQVNDIPVVGRAVREVGYPAEIF